jgi:hypothetical protein
VTTTTDEIYFWVGHPPTEESTNCGIRTFDKLGVLVRQIEDTYGTVIVLDCNAVPEAICLVTVHGYRVLLADRRHVDVSFSQESASEWVAGAW